MSARRRKRRRRMATTRRARFAAGRRAQTTTRCCCATVSAAAERTSRAARHRCVLCRTAIGSVLRARPSGSARQQRLASSAQRAPRPTRNGSTFTSRRGACRPRRDRSATRNARVPLTMAARARRHWARTAAISREFLLSRNAHGSTYRCSAGSRCGCIRSWARESIATSSCDSRPTIANHRCETSCFLMSSRWMKPRLGT